MATNVQKLANIAAKVQAMVQRSIGKGLATATVFIVARTKEALSEPAPRVKVRVAGPKSGISHYRAATRATPLAPPRKLSGRLRTGIMGKMLTPTRAVVGTNVRAMPSRKYPGGFSYGKYHEVKQSGMPGSGKHQFIKPTVAKYIREIRAIVGRNIKLR